MTVHLSTTLICISALLISLTVLAIKVKEAELFDSHIEIWMASIALFVVLLNVIFELLSLLPMDKPIRALTLPIHLILLIVGIFTICKQKALTWFAVICNDLRGHLQSTSWLTASMAAVIVLTVLAWSVCGTLNYPNGIDELSYHGPQAFGIYQQGHVRDFMAWPTWVYYYPHGGAVLWAWTMLFTGSDLLVHGIQVLFVVQLLLAVWVLAGKLGANGQSKVMAILVVCSMPVLYSLATTIGADLGYSAAMLSFLALLAPGKALTGSSQLLARFGMAMVMLAEAAFIKIPILPLIYFSFSATAFLWSTTKAGQFKQFQRDALRSKYSAAVVICLAFGFSNYAINWVQKGNPFYPLTIRFGGVNILNGTLWPIEDAMVVHSTFGDVRAMSGLQRWHAVFADWFQHINTDALGGAGPVFLMIVLALALSEVAGRLTQPSAWDWAMLGMLTLVFFIPGAYLPRYSLVWLCLLAALASAACSRISKVNHGMVWVVVLGAMMGLAKQVTHMRTGLVWNSSMSSPKSLLEDRGHSIPEKIDVDRIAIPSAHMLSALRKHIKTDQTLYYSTKFYATFMWNSQFDNSIRYFPTVRLVDQLPVNIPPENDEEWFGTIENKKPDWLLVYANSGVAARLSSPVMNAAYEVIASDAPSGNPSIDQWNVVLLRRTHRN